MGHHWAITNGGMAGVVDGSPGNVSVDPEGHLHLRITETGGTWTAAEMFSTDLMGFGTYEWQLQGNVYAMDPSTVLGLFPYGPAAGVGVDGENEIDTEFSQWNGTCGCNGDFTVYPSSGHRFPGGDASWSDNFRLSGGSTTTVRMEWSPGKIVFTVMDGLQPIGTTASVLKTETYAADALHIPQAPLPVGMNLWCFETTPAQPQEVVLLSFAFVPQS
jgi:hypothetical protein